MVFTDLTFLFAFLPIVWLVYRFFIARTPLANLYIFVASMIFYAWGGLRSLAILLLVLLWNYLSAKRIAMEEDLPRRKMILWIALGVDLLVLFFYRYLGVWFGFASNALSRLPSLMPLGLSFYLFSCMSCVIDVYRDGGIAPDSFVNFGVLAAFFGHVNMGPIVHYAKFQKQIKSHPLTRRKTTQGMTLLLQGMFRKVILADNLALVFAALAGNTTWLGNLLYGFSYFFMLYFDFSGYSRMARGIGALFGFEIPKNFDLPYTALSVQDFWRRWHISLTDWFRDYVYIPLGGNRVSHTRWMLNVLCVWLLTGLWHGATLPFLVWGLYQGAMILLERSFLNKILEKLPKFVRHIYLVLAQLIGWTFFCSGDIASGFAVVGRYFGIGATGAADSMALFVFSASMMLLIVCIVLSSGLSVLLGRMVCRLSGKAANAVSTIGWVCMFAVCVAMLVSASAQTFLYAAF